jgi:hypothetical protein
MLNYKQKEKINIFFWVKMVDKQAMNKHEFTKHTKARNWEKSPTFSSPYYIL